MRAFLSLLLIGLIASCPIVCGTAHDPSSDDGHHHASGGDHPLPAPVNDDCCVCNGALACSPGNASHSLGLDLSAGPHPWDVPCILMGLLPTLVDATTHLARIPSPGDCSPFQRGSARLPFLRC